MRRDQNKVNRLNHSAANVALVTAQVNSEKGSKFTLAQFLPYGQAGIQPMDINLQVLGTILESKSRLPAELRQMVFDTEIYDQLVATYYWRSGSALYD